MDIGKSILRDAYLLVIALFFMLDFCGCLVVRREIKPCLTGGALATI